MKEIVVISGKGGTGKTFLTSSLATVASNKVILDCDVDAANLYLVLGAEVLKEEDFSGAKKPVIDYEKCIKCGECKNLCRFNAIDQEINILENFCEGCGLCALICPQQAIQMKEEINGKVYVAKSKYGEFVYAKLGIAAENSGKLVSRVREIGREIAQRENKSLILTDGPPGIGCPVISSLSGANLAIVVTEPTYSGISDMQRVIEVGLHFGLKIGIVINKYDINLERTQEIKNYARNMNFALLGKIPFSKKVPQSIVQAQPYPQLYKDEISNQIFEIWNKAQAILNET